MTIWDRRENRFVEEKEFQKRKLEFLYNTLVGRVLLKLLISRRWFSKICSYKYSKPKSLKIVGRFIEEHKIDMSEYDTEKFICFNDFFERRREYFSNARAGELIAIADARLSVFTIEDNLDISIKNSIYSMSEITGNICDLDAYRGGVCLVYRLAVDDYHRYVFCDDGEVKQTMKINGVLHTVRPVSSRYKVYARNHRIVNILKSSQFGNIIQIEVGALLVGKINNFTRNKFKFLEEKGYFSYGGSTIIQLFESGTVKIDDDIKIKCENGVESMVRIGEVIGEII